MRLRQDFNLKPKFLNLHLNGFCLYYFQTIDTRLSRFVASDLNEDADCCFVVINGHGFGEDHNVHIKTTDGFYNIWARCQHLFTKKASRLRQKPKVFIIQVCRSGRYILLSISEKKCVQVIIDGNRLSLNRTSLTKFKLK